MQRIKGFGENALYKSTFYITLHVIPVAGKSSLTRIMDVKRLLLLLAFLWYISWECLQCFNAVGCVARRASGL